MMYGSERTTTTLDDQGSTLTVINKIREGHTVKTFKQYNVRVKVRDSKEEMAEYLKHAESIRGLRTSGQLVIKDNDDNTLVPSFRIEYPKTDMDGSYFIIKSWSQVSEL